MTRRETLTAFALIVLVSACYNASPLMVGIVGMAFGLVTIAVGAAGLLAARRAR